MGKIILIFISLFLISCGSPVARIENDGTTTVAAPSLGGSNYVKVETAQGHRIEIATDHNESFNKGATSWMLRKVIPQGVSELGGAANNAIETFGN